MTLALFPSTPATAPGSSHWRIAADGDPVALDLHSRHYSARTYADGRPRRLIVGPGEKLVLVARDDRALFAWRRMAYSLDGQVGICCTVFRREAGALASDLIREADALADDRWPGVRHYTYVSASRVASTNPGYCFLRAGWRRCGLTKGGHGRDQLIILERC